MLAAGTRLGPYEILAPIGAGGMGEVYRARDTKLDRDVAIKGLPLQPPGGGGGRGGALSIRPRGEGGRRALPSQHPRNFRLRKAERRCVCRDGAAPRRDS